MINESDQVFDSMKHQTPNIIDNRGKRVTYTNQLLDYRNYRQFSDYFIETGSAAGDGIQRAIFAGFPYIASIEAAKLWFDMCITRFEAVKGVQLFLGKSTDVLGEVLRWTPDSIGRAVIFLDAHPAGPLSAGHQEWLDNPNGDAAQDNIIQAELRIILAHRQDHVIIIDDVNGQDDGCADKYMDLCLAANPNYRFEFWSENLSGNLLYPNKILVCLPN